MATAKQIPFLMGRLVEHQGCFNPLSSEDTQWAGQHPQEAIALFIKAVENRQQEDQAKPEPQPLLTLAGSTTVQPSAQFVVADNFVKNTKKDAPVKIGWIGGNIKGWFFGKVGSGRRPNAEETAPGDGPYRVPGKNGDDKSVIRYYNLNYNSKDVDIIAELGGEDKAKTTMAEIYALMRKQANNKIKNLLTNGYANIFYVCDISGMLRAVSVRWRGDDWHVYACLVEDSFEWDAGYRVFSRDSELCVLDT